MLGADVVVAEGQGGPHRQVEDLAAVGGEGQRFAERDRVTGVGRLGRHPRRGGQRGQDGDADPVGIDAAVGQRAHSQTLRLGPQAGEDVGRGDGVGAGGAGGLLGGQHALHAAVGEAAEAPYVDVEVGDGRRLTRHETLLHRLLGYAERVADLGPGGAGGAGRVDEVADEVVGEGADGGGRLDGFGQAPERIRGGAAGLDAGDQGGEAREFFHTSRLP